MEQYKQERGPKWTAQAPLCDRQIVTELSSDISLPDYQPEIKRLLRVCVTASPVDKYVGSGSAELSGSVDYSILYAGNDGELYCANQTQEYHLTVPVELPADFDPVEGILCDARSFSDSAVSRVTAPRKLSIKCRLRTRVRMYGMRSVEERITGAFSGEPERLMGEAECARVFFGSGEPLALADEILPENPQRDLRVIQAQGCVFITEAVAGSGSVHCRGEACLRLLCAQEGGEGCFALTRRIPFAQEVPTDGAEVNCDCCADGVCTELRVTVEDGRILCDVVIRLRTQAHRNEILHYTKDIYTTGAECDARYGDYAFPKALRCSNGNFSLNTTLTAEECRLPSDCVVADMTASAFATALEAERGRLYLTGKCQCKLLLSEGGEKNARELEVPFRYEMERNGEDEILQWEASVEVISCRARADGERLGIDAELAVSLAAYGESRFRAAEEVTVQGPAAGDVDVYRICYPAREDTLWSVAKRYHLPIEALAEENALPGAAAADSRESLLGVKYLLLG
ncbi:MAG: hypothetical protein IIX80_02445 [Clostridia bacterium]|nr:hypothetical protein [Clostridia bacterium]